ncbi:hypothetical protein D3C80_1609300 [compost metagenome]
MRTFVKLMLLRVVTSFTIFSKESRREGLNELSTSFNNKSGEIGLYSGFFVSFANEIYIGIEKFALLGRNLPNSIFDEIS